MNNLIIGTLFALCAAALNASIGVISKLLMHSGLNPQDIAFLKTIIAFFFLSVF
ncbi:EamA/RhaT family transporter, partial [Acinetobacter baumannii]|nr:EamA/RhaT family transporter [Acinetobacter baumannii]